MFTVWLFTEKACWSWDRWWFLSTIVQSLSCVQLLWHHGLQHTSLSCPLLCPGICSNSCPLRLWCHPAISSSGTPFSSCLQSFPASGSFLMNWLFIFRWPKYWSFSFSVSPPSEDSGLISFRLDWLDLLAVQDTLKGFLQHHGSKASILQCLDFFIVQLSHPSVTTGKMEKP